jgi:hypothetical protein
VPRFDVRLGLNRADRSMPKTWYLFADAEAFVNLGDPTATKPAFGADK